MKHPALLLGLLLLASSFASADEPAANSSQESVTPSPPAAPRVRVVTSMGSFTIELNAERAPLTVANFLHYVDAGQYTGTVFHRVIANFVIQGGGYDTSWKLKKASKKVVNESGNGLSNLRGTVGMARAADPHGADCQFFVNLADNPALDPSPSRWGYAVFGRVTDGMDVVDRIGNVATGANGPFKEDSPERQVVIERVERLPANP